MRCALQIAGYLGMFCCLGSAAFFALRMWVTHPSKPKTESLPESDSEINGDVTPWRGF